MPRLASRGASCCRLRWYHHRAAAPSGRGPCRLFSSSVLRVSWIHSATTGPCAAAQAAVRAGWSARRRSSRSQISVVMNGPGEGSVQEPAGGTDYPAPRAGILQRIGSDGASAGDLVGEGWGGHRLLSIE